jgi:hypothetical protein
MPRIGAAGAGVHVWFKLSNPLVFWLELGPQKTPVFLQGGAAMAAMALQIPLPYGPIVASIAAAQLASARANVGPNGLWIKFGPTGYIRSKGRTRTNREKMPNPF